MRLGILHGYSAMMASSWLGDIQGGMARKAQHLESRISEWRCMGTPLSQPSRSVNQPYDFSEIVAELQKTKDREELVWARRGNFSYSEFLDSGSSGCRINHAGQKRDQMSWLERREWDAFAGRFDRFAKAVEILTGIQNGTFWENGEDLFFNETEAKAEAACWALKQVRDFSTFLGRRHDWARRAEQRASEKLQFPEKYFFSPLWRGLWLTTPSRLPH